jgi:hypothetical protein
MSGDDPGKLCSVSYFSYGVTIIVIHKGIKILSLVDFLLGGVRTQGAVRSVWTFFFFKY